MHYSLSAEVPQHKYIEQLVGNLPSYQGSIFAKTGNGMLREQDSGEQFSMVGDTAITEWYLCKLFSKKLFYQQKRELTLLLTGEKETGVILSLQKYKELSKLTGIYRGSHVTVPLEELQKELAQNDYHVAFSAMYLKRNFQQEIAPIQVKISNDGFAKEVRDTVIHSPSLLLQ
jgi:hypothetical protein